MRIAVTQCLHLFSNRMLRGLSFEERNCKSGSAEISHVPYNFFYERETEHWGGGSALEWKLVLQVPFSTFWFSAHLLKCTGNTVLQNGWKTQAVFCHRGSVTWICAPAVPKRTWHGKSWRYHGTWSYSSRRLSFSLLCFREGCWGEHREKVEAQQWRTRESVFLFLSSQDNKSQWKETFFKKLF